MENLKMHTPNMFKENVLKIKELFPHCVSLTVDELGETEYSIDFDKLKIELVGESNQEYKERYNLTWPGKNTSIISTNSISTDTLRPYPDESLDFLNTENVYIEGNNFEVLKIMRETYLGQVGIIYIDPPYNTGRNLLYKNDFSMDNESYQLINNEVDEDGNRLFMNRESSGRHHTKWLNIMYPTLKVARDILKDEGIIVIAIDDYEYSNLKKICDEIFFVDNYIGTIITRSNPQGRGKKNIDPQHEYHIIYAKDRGQMDDLKLQRQTDENAIQYKSLKRTGTNSRKEDRPNRFYPILVKDNILSMISDDEYLNIYQTKKEFDYTFINELTNKYVDEGYELLWPKIIKDGIEEDAVWQRQFDRVKKEISTYQHIKTGDRVQIPHSDTYTPQSLWLDKEHSNVEYGTNHLIKMFDGKNVFEYPKSIYTVKDLISLIDTEYVMDFFPGSATTAEAVMMQNLEDGKDRKYILIQLPENLEENKEMLNKDERKIIENAINLCEDLNLAKTIPEVAKERIRRAGERLKPESEDLDIGFRVFRLDSSNMEDVYYKPSEIQQSIITDLVSTVKKERTSLDLLFQVMLELGYKLSSKISVKNYNGKKYYIVANSLVACFDKQLISEDISKFATIKPDYIVVTDNSFENDQEAINAVQVVLKISPTTELRKV